MHPLNPFLRAFFRSPLHSQCIPVQNHILLVPTTEVLLNSRDKETGALYSELSSSEDFLASHVLRIPAGASSAHGKDGATFKDNRNKAKQFSTLNGKTVIVKDTFVYSNKGFKNLNQAQLLSDAIYQPDTHEVQQWLVYYITKPLIGSLEAITIVPASLELITAERTRRAASPAPDNASSSAALPQKKEIKSFSELLNNFPMIARQMQGGLERLFREMSEEFDKPLPSRPPSVASRRSRSTSVSSARSSAANSFRSSFSSSYGHVSELILDDEEDLMRKSLETAVTAAIDLFQMVDKHQLSLLGATTDLTGPVVERMIERYIAEQVHDTVIFPRICAVRREEDLNLESLVKQMADIDISQVGIPLSDSQRAKRELSLRISKGVDAFKKMGVAGSPQETMEVLLATQKLITTPDAISEVPNSMRGKENQSEKQDLMLTINADILVSLLLIVVIRSPVRHLQARLSYMRHFIFIDDVESGEMGYALSTFEAVLSYLARDAGGLRKSSRRNKRLWHATRKGDVAEMRYLLEPDSMFTNGDPLLSEPHEIPSDLRGLTDNVAQSIGGTTLNGLDLDHLAPPNSQEADSGLPNGLSHVFVFQRAPTPPPSGLELPPKMKKRVSMETRSTSSSSRYSLLSRTTTPDNNTDADLSLETLARTQGNSGNSVLMMAVESGQEKSLQYLLSLGAFYGPDMVLKDSNNEGTTLLNAAVQTGNVRVIETLLDYIFSYLADEGRIRAYISLQDSKGRCAAHYFFNTPGLISRLAHVIPWRLKDKNGQTPLFALCRSYDHAEYYSMIDAALTAASDAQKDGLPLHLDDHVDSKGNTLLHIINDPQIAIRMLYRCDSDINAANDRHFTPFMVASKYGRAELIRALFGDPRLDLFAKDLRGLTAVELAKDDDMRNRIDDLVMLASPPAADGRTTTVVRSYFVEDGSVRLILKSGMPNKDGTVTVMTCRRSLTDFENLARLLRLELPASWLPSMEGFQSPFLFPSKPSRAVLRDIQIRLDNVLHILLSHSTFSTHELVWEFFLVPDINMTQLEDRSRRKAEAREDMVREEYLPITDVREVELFVGYARDSVRSVHNATCSVLRRITTLRRSESDLYESALLSSASLSTLTFLPPPYILALTRFAKTLAQPSLSPSTAFYYTIHGLLSTSAALLHALNRPASLTQSMGGAQKAIDKQTGSLRRTDRWPNALGLLDEARARSMRDAQAKADKAQEEKDQFGRELRYTQQVVAGELAGWQEERVRWVRGGLRELAKRMVVTERARLEGMRRAVRGLGLDVEGKTRRKMDLKGGNRGTLGSGRGREVDSRSG